MTEKEKNIQKSADRLVVFEDKQIRRVFHNGEWYFSIIDIIRILTASSDANRYGPELKRKLYETRAVVSGASQEVLTIIAKLFSDGSSHEVLNNIVDGEFLRTVLN